MELRWDELKAAAKRFDEARAGLIDAVAEYDRDTEQNAERITRDFLAQFLRPASGQSAIDRQLAAEAIELTRQFDNTLPSVLTNVALSAKAMESTIVILRARFLPQAIEALDKGPAHLQKAAETAINDAITAAVVTTLVMTMTADLVRLRTIIVTAFRQQHLPADVTFAEIKRRILDTAKKLVDKESRSAILKNAPEVILKLAAKLIKFSVEEILPFARWALKIVMWARTLWKDWTRSRRPPEVRPTTSTWMHNLLEELRTENEFLRALKEAYELAMDRLHAIMSGTTPDPQSRPV